MPVKELVKRFVPEPVVGPAASAWRRLRRSIGTGAALSGVRPRSEIWGLDRGTPIERHYVETFLAAHGADIRGRVLEMGDARYTKRFGGDRVTRSEVLNLAAGNPEATIVGDLVSGRDIPVAAFDCAIVVNTFLVIHDVSAAIATCHRMLRPGGVLLAHFTALARRAHNDEDWGPPGWSGDGDSWRFTRASARRLCETQFPPDAVTVTGYGNVRAAAASLYGLAAEELTAEELGYLDPRFDVAVCVRAVRRAPS